MAYGITINTSIEISDNNPNRSGKYGLVYPAPGKLFNALADAEKVFEQAIAERRSLNDDFVATLNEYGRGEKTIRKATLKQ